MQRELEMFGVQISSVNLTAAYISSISLVFEVILLPSLQQNALVTFDDYFNFDFSTFGGFAVREGNRGLSGVVATGKCAT